LPPQPAQIELHVYMEMLPGRSAFEEPADHSLIHHIHLERRPDRIINLFILSGCFPIQVPIKLCFLLAILHLGNMDMATMNDADSEKYEVLDIIGNAIVPQIFIYMY
jgi:hypothetical protein